MAENSSYQQELSEKLSLAHEVIEHRLTAIWRAIDSIDTKTNIILGFASVVLVFLAGFYSSGNREWPIASLIFFILALIAYVIILVLSILSYRIKEWSYRPDPSTLIGYSQDGETSITDIKAWTTTECKLAIDTNLTNLRNKAALTNWALKIFGAETVLLTIGLVYTMF